MGKKKPQQKPQPAKELLDTLTDFTSQDNWDKFFTIRGGDDAFEWYAEWPEIQGRLLLELRANLGEADPAAVQILVPGCGNSKLSEHLYDAGFHGITNIDFSKVVISDMLRRNVRDRPKMRWRVMDMTSMQLPGNGFDAVVDKGGLDALMEPEHGDKLGEQYLKEVQRVLKTGGKFICLTLAESHVLDLLLPTFRFGWRITVHSLHKKSSSKSDLRTFMVVAEKVDTLKPEQITTTFEESLSLNPSDSNSDKQVNGLFKELNDENVVRESYIDADALLTLKDLRLGARGDLTCIIPGRRCSFVLGDNISRFSYRAVLLDAKQGFDTQSLYGIMLVPKPQVNEWLYSSEEGPWTLVENAKVARLIMVYFESIHMRVPVEELQHDLSPLVKQLAPAGAVHSQIPFMMVQGTFKSKKIVGQASSSLTGQIIVEDVAYDNTDNAVSQILPCSAELRCRRLIFQRSSNLVQSEALIDTASAAKDPNGADKKNNKSKKKGGQDSDGFNGSVKINHDYLASEYHSGIISGFTLISSYLETMGSSGNGVRTVVIGLGAGLLPMFLHGCLPFTLVESVELDPIIVQLARDYFGFCEDARLKVHMTDGIKFIEGVASNVNTKDEKGELLPSSEKLIDILIVDVDSDDPSLGLSCPAQGFVDESFLKDARDSLSDQGLLVINLVTRSSSTKEKVISKVKKIFNNLYTLELEEDVNQILFALKTNECIPEDKFPEAVCQLKKLLNCREAKMTEAILDASSKIRYLG